MMKEYRYTYHARQQMNERKIDSDMINCQIIASVADTRHDGIMLNLMASGVIVATNDDEKKIVTVYYTRFKRLAHDFRKATVRANKTEFNQTIALVKEYEKQGRNNWQNLRRNNPPTVQNMTTYFFKKE